MHQALGERFILRRIELKKSRSAFERGGDGLEGIVRQRGRDQGHSRCNRCARGGEIAVPVRRADADDAHWTHEYRRRKANAEKLDRQIADPRIHHHPRHHAPMAKRQRVVVLRPLVAAAALHVIQHAGRQRARHSLFEPREIHWQIRQHAL